MPTEDIQRLLRNWGHGIVAADAIDAMRERFNAGDTVETFVEMAAWDAFALAMPDTSEPKP